MKDLFGYKNPKKIAYTATFIALSVIINTLRVGNWSFGGFFIIVSGFSLGPVGGFVVGCLADIVGFLIRPGGAFQFEFVLTSGLTGMIPVSIAMMLGNRYPNYKIETIFIGIALGQLITSVLLVPYFLHIKLGFNYQERLISAFIKQAPSIPLYAFVYSALNRYTNKVVRFDKFHKKVDRLENREEAL